MQTSEIIEIQAGIIDLQNQLIRHLAAGFDDAGKRVTALMGRVVHVQLFYGAYKP